ncbi:hypothetical protein, partial [Citrobacter sp. wls708]|uniref:hypothetical protein n=1 Tax=Citrobacter sp. wls708 TaxID=2576427 RepID=UPI001BAF2BD2
PSLFKHNVSSSLKAALSNECRTGLASSKKKTVGHLAHMNGGSLNGIFAHMVVAFEMQREPLVTCH